MMLYWPSGSQDQDSETGKKVKLAIKAMNKEDKFSWLNLHMRGVKILKSGPNTTPELAPLVSGKKMRLS